MKKILVTGTHGQLGAELRRVAWPNGRQVVAVDHDMLYLTYTAAIGATFAGGHDDQPFAAVIKGASYTAADQAEPTK